MATITALVDGFETGAVGDAATTSNTIFDAITGTGTAVFASGALEGSKCLRVQTTASNQTLRADFPAAGSAWLSLAVRLNAAPNAYQTLIQFCSGTSILGTVRVDGAGVWQLRDGTVQAWASSTSPAQTGVWYELRLLVNPGGDTTRLKVYDAATGALVHDSGSQALASVAATTWDNVRVGSPASNVTSDSSFDRMGGDTTTEPATLNTPAAPAALALTVTGGGPVDAGTTQAIAATASGGTLPRTVSIAQTSGPARTLTRSGDSWSFTTPRTSGGTALGFRVTATDSASSPATVTRDVVFDVAADSDVVDAGTGGGWPSWLPTSLQFSTRRAEIIVSD